MSDPPVQKSGKTRASSFYARSFAIVGLALLAMALFRILQPFLGAIAWALLLAFLLHPTQVRLSRWFKGRRSLSAFTLSVTTLLVFVGPLTALGVAFVRQMAALIERLQAGVGDVNLASFGSLKTVPLLGSVLTWLEAHAPVSPQRFQSWALSGAEATFKYFAAAGGSLFMGAIGTAVGFVMMLFLLFFFLRDGAEMLARLIRLVPMTEKRKRELVDYLAAATRAVVFGTLLTAVIQGALVGIAFAIVGLPSPVVFAVLAGVLSLVPMGGTAIVWIPAALVLVAQDRNGAAIFMLLWGALLVGLIDNLLKPLLISGRAEVPTLAAFLGVLGGLAAFGAVGMFLGPVLLALTLALLRHAEEQRNTAQ